MKIRTKQATTVLTKQLPEMRQTARTAVKTALQILQRTHPATKHPVHTTENRTNTPTKNNIKLNFNKKTKPTISPITNMYFPMCLYWLLLLSLNNFTTPKISFRVFPVDDTTIKSQTLTKNGGASHFLQFGTLSSTQKTQ